MIAQTSTQWFSCAVLYICLRSNQPCVSCYSVCCLSDEVNLKLFMTGLRADCHAKLPGLSHTSSTSLCLHSRLELYSRPSVPGLHQCTNHLVHTTGTHIANPSFHHLPCQPEQQHSGGGCTGRAGQPGQASQARAGPADAGSGGAPHTSPYAAPPRLWHFTELLPISKVSELLLSVHVFDIPMCALH